MEWLLKMLEQESILQYKSYETTFVLEYYLDFVRDTALPFALRLGWMYKAIGVIYSCVLSRRFGIDDAMWFFYTLEEFVLHDVPATLDIESIQKIASYFNVVLELYELYMFQEVVMKKYVALLFSDAVFASTKDHEFMRRSIDTITRKVDMRIFIAPMKHAVIDLILLYPLSLHTLIAEVAIILLMDYDQDRTMWNSLYPLVLQHCMVKHPDQEADVLLPFILRDSVIADQVLQESWKEIRAAKYGSSFHAFRILCSTRHNISPVTLSDMELLQWSAGAPTCLVHFVVAGQIELALRSHMNGFLTDVLKDMDCNWNLRLLPFHQRYMIAHYAWHACCVTKISTVPSLLVNCMSNIFKQLPLSYCDIVVMCHSTL